jgi:hypothetical protein
MAHLGANARLLATIVLAAELSLLDALTAGQLCEEPREAQPIK